MNAHLAGFTSTDAILVIECPCGNSRMLDEADGVASEMLYVYRYGVPTKNLRCHPTERVSLANAFLGQPECRMRYRINLHRENGPPNSPYMEVVQISPRPQEEVIEVETIRFPQGTGTE